MRGFSGEMGIEVFSNLIETVLYCRLGRKKAIGGEIEMAIESLQAAGDDGRDGLNAGIEMFSKLHEGSDFKVLQVLKGHFVDHQTDSYCICLEIFALHNKRQQQYFSQFYDKNTLIEKWVFRKQPPARKSHRQSISSHKSDLFVTVLRSIRERMEQQRLQNPNEEMGYNTTDMKSYQLVIKSKCAKKGKYVTHVFHHERNDRLPSLHTRHSRCSLLELSKYWEKTLRVSPQGDVSVGCYFSGKTSRETTNKKISPSSDIVFLRQPDRKLSSETKAEERQKSSTSSFRFSLENFPFPLGKGFKHSSAELPVVKQSEEIFQQHRPRYQSIYESRDEEMNIFILSPRKLSDEQSPKMRYLEQKPIQFQIYEHRYSRGISEEVIEEFVLEPDTVDNVSNVSSDGFEMLYQEDGMKEQGEKKENEQVVDERQKQLQKILGIITQLEEEICSVFGRIDKKFSYFI